MKCHQCKEQIEVGEACRTEQLPGGLKYFHPGCFMRFGDDERAVDEAFEPENGAYGEHASHAGHGHPDQGHSHDHAHDHAPKHAEPHVHVHGPGCGHDHSH